MHVNKIVAPLALALFGAAAGPVASNAGQVSPIPLKIDAAEYWYHHALGSVLEVRNDGQTITGVLRGRHGRIPFQLTAEAASDNWGRAVGYKRAVSDLIAWLERGVNRSRQEAREKLPLLTGERLDTAKAWRDWFTEGEPYFAWNADRALLAVDEDARSAGIPAQQFRQKRLH